MNVYLLTHDDRSYDMGDSYVRGVYRDREHAEADIVTRAPSGRRSEAYDAHNESCCGVEEWDVLTVAQPEVKDDPAPFDGPQESIIPDAVVHALAAVMFENATTTNPYWPKR